MSIRVHPWLILVFGGRRKFENGPKTAFWAFWGALEGLQTRFSTVPTSSESRETQIHANGGIRRGFSAGKQEICMKTGGETGLHLVFLLFPVFLLSRAF